jgi:hypothetical protein
MGVVEAIRGALWARRRQLTEVRYLLSLALVNLGATTVCVMNVAASDPLGMIRTYGEHVLPALREEEH